MKVHIATIHHKHGTNFYVGLTRESALKQVADYCRAWWEDPADLPATDEEAVAVYFDWIAEVVDSESYDIIEVEAI